MKLLGALMVIAAAGSAQADDTGVLCLRKLPAAQMFAQEGKGSAGPSYDDTPAAAEARRTREHRLSVSVDGRPATIDQKGGDCIEGLPLAGRHVARVSRDGRAFQSARFSFPRDASLGRVMELHYDPFYANVQIEPHRSRAALVGKPATCAICTDAARAALPPAPPAPALYWLILRDGDALSLRVEPVAAMGVGALVAGEKPTPPAKGPRVHQLDGGFVSARTLGFSTPAPLMRRWGLRVPQQIELRLMGEQLLVNEKPAGRHWVTYRFDRSP